MLTISLDAPQRRKLRAELGFAVDRANRGASPLEAQLLVREASHRIARDVFGDALLDAARKRLQSGGIITWSGLPGSELEPADTQGDLLTFGQALAAVIAQGTTLSFGFVQEDEGLHFQRLYPVSGLINCGKTHDSLLPHLDNAMLIPAAQPETIHLVCVNNDAQAGTIFFSVDAVLRGLREGFEASVIDRLYEPAYVTALSNSFVADPSAKSITTRARPILYRGRGKGSPVRFLGKAYDMGVAPEMNDRAAYEHALAAFQQVLKERHDLAFSIMPLPGQAVSFNQQRMLHGRGPIVPGKYREMVRSYGRFDFAELEQRMGRLPPHYVFDGIQLVDR
ncbi:MAG TPA: TauD/TfdA family dioxygenase [Pirellulales bacterium]|nr:TauD/TfdA family dioxygenase [Pirellulales bacterium]